MKLRLNVFLIALAVAVLSAALLVPIAGASSWGTNSGPGSMMGGGPGSMMGGGTGNGGWCGGGIWNGTGSWGGTGLWGTGSGMHWLTDNPAAMQAWLQLKADHIKALQTWQDTYKADLTTPAAQQALHDLWVTNWNDMKSFYEHYANGAVWTALSSGMWGGWQMGSMMGGGSWNANHMWGTGYGAAWMMNHPAGVGQWLTMRGRQTTAVNAWLQQHASAPGSPAAQAALGTLHVHQRAQVKHFYQHHHLSATSSHMRYGAGGWMGLGGMWGGFGW